MEGKLRPWLAVAIIALVACTREKVSSNQTTAHAAQSATSSAATRSPGAEVRSACDSAAARWAAIPGATVGRGDTIVTSQDVLPDFIGDSLPIVTDTLRFAACHTSGMQPMGLDSATRARLYWETSGGWTFLPRIAADGPDGQVRTFQRSWVRCEVRDEWDGGDDSDSTYVPDPFYRERTLCWRHRRLVVAADTILRSEQGESDDEE